MSLKEISESMEKGSVLFGIRQVLKERKKSKKKKLKVFVAKDIRDDTIKRLEDEGIEFEVLKSKSEISKVLGLNFESEVFLIR